MYVVKTSDEKKHPAGSTCVPHLRSPVCQLRARPWGKYDAAQGVPPTKRRPPQGGHMLRTRSKPVHVSRTSPPPLGQRCGWAHGNDSACACRGGCRVRRVLRRPFLSCPAWSQVSARLVHLPPKAGTVCPRTKPRSLGPTPEKAARSRPVGPGRDPTPLPAGFTVGRESSPPRRRRFAPPARRRQGRTRRLRR